MEVANQLANETLAPSHGFSSRTFQVPYVFNDTFELITPPERALSTAMGCYWANFAATGDPNNGSACADVGVGVAQLPVWPRWDAPKWEAIVFNQTIGLVSGLAVQRCAVLDGVPIPP